MLLVACAAARGGYVEEVRAINEAHARDPGRTREAELAARLSPAARREFDATVAGKDIVAIISCAEAALDLDRMEDFERARRRLEALDPAKARGIGIALSRERFLARGIGGLERPWLERFADLCDAILKAYDEVFGFREWSKVPGKKLRIRAHLEPAIDRPPHFAPQFPWHSEVDFPVADGREFRSPTPDGKFLFYGLCHEFGHVIAMWGDTRNEEDHHAWAHYTGVVITEHLRIDKLEDARWRSLTKERERLAKCKPSLEDRDGVLALLVSLHEVAGPKALGDAINALDAGGKALRVNRVRYYRMKDLREALLRTLKGAARKKVEKLWP